MSIADEKYVSLTTYRSNGEAKELPVWIVDLGDGTIGFTTDGNSWKCKRIRNNNRIALQPCDQRGNIREGTEKVAGTATVVTGAEMERVRAKIKDKYGFMVTVINTVYKVRRLFSRNTGASEAAVVITLGAS